MLLFYSDRDGIPPYRLRKQHRREMQESAKANGRVPLPHIPVSSTISFPRGKYAKYVRSLAYGCSACSSLTPVSAVFIWGCSKTEIHHSKKGFDSLLPKSSSRAVQDTQFFLTVQSVASGFSHMRVEARAGIYLQAGYVPSGELELFVEGVGGHWTRRLM